MAKGSTNVLQGTGSGFTLQGGRSGVSLQAKPITLQGGAPVNQIKLGSGSIAAKPGVPAPVVPGPAVNTNNSAAVASAASAAADRARLGTLSTESRGLIDSIKNIYGSIYGKADTAAAEQNQQLTDNYGKTVADTAGEVARNNDAALAAYSARGTQDSSYRGNTQNDIKVAGERAVQEAGDELRSAQGSIGQWLNEQRANVTAQKTGLDQVLSRIAESKDVNELTQLRATLENRLTEAQQASAGLTTGAQNRATAAGVTPAANRVATLKTTLGNILQSTAPPATKRSIATAFIMNSGLKEDQQNELLQQLNGAIA